MSVRPPGLEPGLVVPQTTVLSLKLWAPIKHLVGSIVPEDCWEVDP